MNDILIIIIASMFTAAFSTIVGFGSGLILLGISVLVFPIKEAIPIVTVYYLFNNVNKLLRLKRYIDLRISKTVILYSIPFVVIGSILMTYISGDIVSRCIGIIILVLIILRTTKIKLKVSYDSMIFKLGSMLYGFFSGFVGSGGVIKAFLLSDVGLVKETFVATMAFTAMFMNVIKIALYSGFDLMNTREIPLYIGLYIGSIIGVTIGTKFLRKIDEKLFERMLYIVLLLMSIKMIFI